MKVVGVLGSPRKDGTSERIARSFLETAEQSGAEVEAFALNRMKYRGCQGCEVCHTKKDRCSLKDDLEGVLEALHQADVAVFATPVYFGDVSGQFKTFFDRTWSLVDVDYTRPEPFHSRLPQGKTAILVLTQVEPETVHRDIIDRYRKYFELYGYKLEIIRGTGLTEGTIDEDVSLPRQEAAKLAERIVRGVTGTPREALQ